MTAWLLGVLMLGACSGSGLDPGRGIVDADGGVVAHDMIVLGNRLEDPYTVENMTKAVEAVYPTKAGRVVLKTTHYYVRFLPEDERQYEWLEQSGLPLLDHPMDYEIVREGDYYHDPEIEDDCLTWQYAVVPEDFVFPQDIRYEVLDKCHIPGGDTSTKGDGIDWEAVEREAYRITGNAGMLEEMPGQSRNDLLPGTKAGSTSGVPAGRITIVDPARGGQAEGVRGVRVQCNCFVKFADAFTDEQGRYRMKTSFSSNPRYRLQFTNSAGFSIGFNLILVPASISTLGTGPVTGLDAEISQNSDRWLFCRSVVSNAGYDYYRDCSADKPSIKTPPANFRLWLFQSLDVGICAMLQQGALIDGSALASLLGPYTMLLKIFLPDSLLGLKGCNTYAEIYAAAVHQFAHASHFMHAGKSFWSDYDRFLIRSFLTSGFVVYGVGTEEGAGICEVAEMWAYFMETLRYRQRYGLPEEAAFGLGYWFHPQILLQLEERGLSCHKIFQVLDSEVTDVETFQRKLTSYYPEYKSAINQAFTRYD